MDNTKRSSDTKDGRFWSRYAFLYDRFMKKDEAAYQQMYKKIRTVVKGKNVLELATGTGLIAKNIADAADSVEATDASPKMIEVAKKYESPRLHFSVQDIFNLPYADASYPVIIAANVLHVIPEPEKALAEMKRVLTSDGVLILPTFTHADMNAFARLKSKAMSICGFHTYSLWSPSDYMAFLERNGLQVIDHTVLKSSFPLTYVECRKDVINVG